MVLVVIGLCVSVWSMADLFVGAWGMLWKNVSLHPVRMRKMIKFIVNNIIYTRWWFQIFLIFTPIWGRFPFWLMFFRWVETTNQYIIWGFLAYQSHGMLLYWWAFFSESPPRPSAGSQEARTNAPSFVWASWQWWNMRKIFQSKHWQEWLDPCTERNMARLTNCCSLDNHLATQHGYVMP